MSFVDQDRENSRSHPQRQGNGESSQRVELPAGPLPQACTLVFQILLQVARGIVRNPSYRVKQPQQKKQHRPHHHEHRDRQRHPTEEGDLDSHQRMDQADGDQVGRRAYRRADAPDCRGIRDHQHHSRGVRPVAQASAAVRISHLVHRLEDAKTYGEHHRRCRRIAHPHGDHRGNQPHRRQHPQRMPAYPTHREKRHRQPAVQAVQHHRAGENETADEEEDDRVRKRRQNGLRVSHAQQDAQRRAPNGRHRQRDRLGHPQHGHGHQHRRQVASCRRKDSGRQPPGHKEPQRSRDRPASFAPSFKACLRLGDQPGAGFVVQVHSATLV